MQPAIADLRSQLSERWRQRWPALPEVGADLVDRYAEPARVYHDLHHLADILSRLDELSGGSEIEAAVELAAWFHDAVYDVHRADNEARSAELAERTLSTSLPAAGVAEVARLVLLTATHVVEPGDPDGARLCDADLAILASAPPTYDAYAAQVRQEYRHVPDADFRLGRAAVLRGLLEKPTVFHTPFGQGQWEMSARANLTRELTHLLP